MNVRLVVNGSQREVAVDPRLTLVELVRDGLGLKGTHIGCQTGDCGACTIELDGRCVKSCLLLAGSAEGTSLTTIEGLTEPSGELDVVQQSFWDAYGFQCGFCLPGMLFVTRELLASNPSPTEQEIREALVGNLCRCTGYVNIVRAVQLAAQRLAA
jgi:carbon-monoxide dehydrogenase small subunit